MDTRQATDEDGGRICCDVAGARAVPDGETATEAALFKALGDPTRLGILQLLTRHGEPVCVCDITGHFELNQPTISHHLKLLRDAGLVGVSRHGTWAYYSVRVEGLLQAREALGDLVGGTLIR